MGVLLYFLTCYILFVNTNEAARILAVIPTPSISHQVVFRPVMQELARRGHDVVVITADPVFPKGKAPANLTEIDVHDISYEIWRRDFMSEAKGDESDLLVQIRSFREMFVLIFETQVKDEQVQRLIKDKNQKFDLIIAEAVFRPAMAYRHVFKAPLILMSSFGATYDNMNVIGAPQHTFLYPSILGLKAGNWTMWEKITELYVEHGIAKINDDIATSEDAMLKRAFGSDIPPVREFYKDVEMLFLNENPVFVGARPVPPSVVYMGGIMETPPKELPKDLKSYLDSSKNGVIYISFGTNVDPTKLPADRIQLLVKAVSQLPYDVLWKWNGDELPGRTENIRISKWLPQSDLLRHPKIKVFVTQGGLQSTDEAITGGVPLVGIPMLGDQWYNVAKYESHRIGVRLDINSLTEEKFRDTLLTVLEDDSYRQNVVNLRILMRDQPMSPLNRTIWWLEHVLRHGGAKHLRSPAANISWAEYLELELVLTLLAALIAAISLLVLTIYVVYKYVKSNYVAVIKVKSS